VWGSSCSSDKVDPKNAYLYGRFINRPESPNPPAYPTIALVLRCTDQPSQTIIVLKRPDLQVIEVKPSHCRFTDMYKVAKNGTILESYTVPDFTAGEFEIAAGRATTSATSSSAPRHT